MKSDGNFFDNVSLVNIVIYKKITNSNDIISGDNDSDSHRRKRKKAKKHHKLVLIAYKTVLKYV